MANRTPDRTDAEDMPFFYVYSTNNEVVAITLSSTAGFVEGDQLAFSNDSSQGVTITGSGITVKTPPGLSAASSGTDATITAIFTSDTEVHLAWHLATASPP